MKKEQLSQIIKSARDIMRKDDNLSTDLDRIPQFSWLLFLKCFDDLEKRRALLNKKHKDAIEVPYRWRDWAADENKGKTGDELIKFVNDKLFPYLRDLVGTGQDDSRDIIASLFKETYNRMRSGYLLRDLVNLVNKIDFNLKDDVHTMAHFYESMLKEMRDAAGTNGEFYTPRPVIRFIVEQVNPKLGETVYDPAAGTCGFLVEAYQHMLKQVKSAEKLEQLRYKTLYGTEKKPMPFLLGMMNLLLHELDGSILVRVNTLSTSLKEITDKQRYDVIITNPPFGGEEERGVLDNFPLETRTSETTLLFMQFIMRSLKRNGGCGIVVPNGFLFGDGIAAKIKKELLENFNLHTIIRLPKGVFEPYTEVQTNLLFFEKTGSTKNIWYCEIIPPEGRKVYTKTYPLKYEEFDECKRLWKSRKKTERSWLVNFKDLEKNNYNLDITNPNSNHILDHQHPHELTKSLIESKSEISKLVEELHSELSKNEILDTLKSKYVKCEEFLRHRNEFITIDSNRDYKRVTAKLHGNGIVLRDIINSSEIKTKKQQLVKPNDLLVAEIDAKVGGFGIVPKGLEGAIVSSHYFLYEIDEEKCISQYLKLFIETGFIENQIQNFVRGSTNYAAIRPYHIYQVKIPLPDIQKQRRIVNLMEKIDELRKLQEHSRKQIDSLLPSILNNTLNQRD